MSGAELAAQLLSISTQLDALPAEFPPTAAANVIAFVIAAENPQLAPFLLALAQAVNPGMTAAELLADLQRIVAVVQGEQTFVSSGECARISGLCKSVAARPIICNLIARFMIRKEAAVSEQVFVSTGLPFLGVWLWNRKVNAALKDGWSIVEIAITPKFLRTACYVRLAQGTVPVVTGGT